MQRLQEIDFSSQFLRDRGAIWGLSQNSVEEIFRLGQLSGGFGSELRWNSIKADEIVVEAEKGIVEGFSGEARISDGDGRIDVVWSNSCYQGSSTFS